ncbi:hypothetical protein TSAR_003814 [Trichomalopsis sarcophagae]|uniref:Uncharacterized protein n=1 Tax=Trichomalopsis sarcophagae TaxID=543379 RepID=A0A232FFM5_9HYME|nr:hypothetical protein TSAR_003814 [Trichomalopsis sarcophagae]
MKYFAVIFAFCFVGAMAALTEEQKAKLKEYKYACITETGVSEDVIESVKKGEQVAFDEKLNCFSACMLKKVGIMNADGTMNEEVARAKVPQDLPKDKVDQVINTCKAGVGKDSCETGGKVLTCLMKTKAVSILH